MAATSDKQGGPTYPSNQRLPSVPIISTRSGWSQDFITGKVGLLVIQGGVEEMSEAMIEKHRKYRTYDPENMRAHCIQIYSERAIVQKLNRIYFKTISRNFYK